MIFMQIYHFILYFTHFLSQQFLIFLGNGAFTSTSGNGKKKSRWESWLNKETIPLRVQVTISIYLHFRCKYFS